MNYPGINYSSELTKTRIARITRMTIGRPQCAREMADALGTHALTVRAILNHLGDKVHIAEWRNCNSNAVPYFAWGAGPDAEKPRRKKDVIAEERARRKAELIARSSIYKPQPVRRDRSVAMLFGEAA